VAYTWSKSIADFGLSDSSGTNSQWALQDVNNPNVDFGRSDINRPHIFVANAIFNLPNFKDSNAFVQTVLGGWEIATIFQISSGTSLTPTIAGTGLTYDGIRNFQAGFTGTGTVLPINGLFVTATFPANQLTMIRLTLSILLHLHWWERRSENCHPWDLGVDVLDLRQTTSICRSTRTSARRG
jgi:hypothetical protein